MTAAVKGFQTLESPFLYTVVYVWNNRPFISKYISLSKYFWSSENWAQCIKMTVIPRWLIKYFCWSPWIKTEYLQFNHIMIASFKISCCGVQRENCKPVWYCLIRDSIQLSHSLHFPHFPLSQPVRYRQTQRVQFSRSSFCICSLTCPGAEKWWRDDVNSE